MALQIGQTLHGAKWSCRLTEALGKGVHKSTIFKAQMLPGRLASVPAEWALVKTTSINRLPFLKREYDAYMRPTIASCSSLRSMYDIVGDPRSFDDPRINGPPCLVFEWMDCTLDHISSKTYRRNSVLLKAIAKAVLSALAALKKEGLVHTDLKPDNVFLSDIDACNPVVKVGDLGITTPEGFNEYLLQPFAMRAPEVWRGLGCFHSSDVWAFAVTLLDWIKPGVFGIRDIKDDHWPEPWCIAKLMRLFPNSLGPPVKNTELEGWFGIAGALAEEMDPDEPGQMYIRTVPLEKELERMDISSELANLFRYLFVIDHKNRPSAAEALRSRELQLLALGKSSFRS